MNFLKTGEFVKSNFLQLALIGFFIWFMLTSPQGCGKGEAGKPDTVIKETTTYVPQPTQHVPSYQPIIFESKQPVVIPQAYQLPSDPEAMKAYCEEIIRKYLAQNRYTDSLTLRDSAGVDVGTFRFNDLVSENMIKSRAPSYTLKFPHTTRTITITNPPPLTRQLFIGAELGGSQKSLFRDLGAGLIYKDRKDNLFGLTAGYSPAYGEPYFKLSRYFKIKFK